MSVCAPVGNRFFESDLYRMSCVAGNALATDPGLSMLGTMLIAGIGSDSEELRHRLELGAVKDRRCSRCAKELDRNARFYQRTGHDLAPRH
jgi:hypothetical protein